MPVIRFFFISIVLFFSSLSLSGQNYYFKQISLKENLSQSNVRAICMDYRGLLWIGTNYGLNRYDGYKLRQYYHQKEDPCSISSDNIFFIEEDSLRNLWIGTRTSLMRYDRENDRFLALEGDLSQLSFRSSVVLKDQIVFLRNDRLLIFRYDTKTFQTILFRGATNNLNMALQGVMLDDQTLLIGARWKGLFTCNIRNGEVKRCNFHEEDNVVSLCRDHNGNLWITSYGKGVSCYTPQGKLLKTYNTRNSSLNNDVVLDMTVTRQGDLWIGTDGGGVNILHMEKQAFSRMEHRPEDDYSIPASAISKLYEDRQGNVWIGTVRGGLLGFKEIFMRSFSNSYPDSKYGLSEQTASCFHEQPGFIWIGTDGGGINKYDPQSNLFTHYQSTSYQKVYSLTDYSENDLLVSFYREGLYIFNKQSGALREFLIPSYIRERIKTGWMGSTVKKIDDTEIILLNDSEVI